jgi:hypothetical protein
MRKDPNYVSLVCLIVAVLLIVKLIDNPRVAALHGHDIIRLVLIGLAFGFAIGVQSGVRVSWSKTPQP